MTTRRKIMLSLPTNFTIEGPSIRKTKTAVIVEYDCERDDGSIHWSSVTFHEPLYFEWSDVSCCKAEDISDSTSIHEKCDSELFKNVIERWQESVGWQDWQVKKGGADRFRHYSIYFDDAAAIHIIASKCTLAGQ